MGQVCKDLRPIRSASSITRQASSREAVNTLSESSTEARSCCSTCRLEINRTTGSVTPLRRSSRGGVLGGYFGLAEKRPPL